MSAQQSVAQSLHWLVFVGCAVLCFIVTFMSAKLSSNEITPLLFALIINVVNALGHSSLVLKARLEHCDKYRFSMPSRSWLIALLTGVVIASNDTSVSYMFKSGADLSVAMPIFTSANVFLTVLFGLIIMKEHLKPKQLVGLICIIIGVACLNA